MQQQISVNSFTQLSKTEHCASMRGIIILKRELRNSTETVKQRMRNRNSIAKFKQYSIFVTKNNTLFKTEKDK